MVKCGGRLGVSVVVSGQNSLLNLKSGQGLDKMKMK